MTAVLLIPTMVWASETEKHVWIPPIKSVIPFAGIFYCISIDQVCINRAADLRISLYYETKSVI